MHVQSIKGWQWGNRKKYGPLENYGALLRFANECLAVNVGQQENMKPTIKIVKL